MFEEQIISTFGQWGVWAVVFVCALLPVIEARVAIPLGCATAVWGGGAMSVLGSSLVAFTASTIAGLLIIITLSPIMKKLRKGKKGKKIVGTIENFFADKVLRFSKKKKHSSFKSMLWLTVFIALPVPLMGVYTGAGIGVFLKLKWWQNFLSIAVGNAFSCALIGLTCWVLYPFIPLLLTCLIIIVSLVIIWYLISLFWNLDYKRKLKKAKSV